METTQPKRLPYGRKERAECENPLCENRIKKGRKKYCSNDCYHKSVISQKGIADIRCGNTDKLLRTVLIKTHAVLKDLMCRYKGQNVVIVYKPETKLN